VNHAELFLLETVMSIWYGFASVW